MPELTPQLLRRRIAQTVWLERSGASPADAARAADSPPIDGEPYVMVKNSVLSRSRLESVLRRNGVPAEEIAKLSERGEGTGPSIVELITSGQIDLIFNTPEGTGDSGAATREDGYHIRTAAVLADVPLVTTVPGLGAATQGIEALQRGEIEVRSLQDWAAAQ